MVTPTAAVIWADGPSSAPSQPPKVDIRAWGTDIETRLLAAQNTLSGISVRKRLTADTNFYIRTDGSDANNGLGDNSAGAFLTIQAAYDYVRRNYDLNGYFANIYVRGGTYTAGLIASGVAYSGPTNSGTGIRFFGDPSNPNNVKITTTGRCFWATYGANIIVSGFELSSSTDSLMYSSAGGSITVQGNMNFGACTGAHMWANVNGTIVISTSQYQIRGNANYHMFAYGNGVIENGTPTVYLYGTPTLGYYAYASLGGVIFAIGTTWSGTCYATRFTAGPLGAIQTGTNGNVNYFPGTVAGVTDAKGYYI